MLVKSSLLFHSPINVIQLNRDSVTMSNLTTFLRGHRVTFDVVPDETRHCSRVRGFVTSSAFLTSSWSRLSNAYLCFPCGCHEMVYETSPQQLEANFTAHRSLKMLPSFIHLHVIWSLFSGKSTSPSPSHKCYFYFWILQ